MPSFRSLFPTFTALAHRKWLDPDWPTWITAFVGTFSMIALRYFSATYPYNRPMWDFNETIADYVCGSPGIVCRQYCRFDTISFLTLAFVIPGILVAMAKRWPFAWAFAPVILQYAYVYAKWNLMQSGYIIGPPMMNPAYVDPNFVQMIWDAALTAAVVGVFFRYISALLKWMWNKRHARNKAGSDGVDEPSQTPASGEQAAGL
jgi:hypothetical protein